MFDFNRTHIPEQIQAIAHWQLQPTLCNLSKLWCFLETLGQLPLVGQYLHIKIDTGMSRLGPPWQESS